MNVLITGGAGYIGSELVYKLSNDTKVNSIIIYDNFSKANYNLFIGLRKLPNPEKIKVVQGDILDSRTLKKALQGVDVVYHLAAFVNTPFSDTDSHFFEQINNWGTAQLTDAIEQSEVEKIIFTSSVSVYGSSDKLMTVNDPLNPRTYYGISKMRAEEHLQRLFPKKQTYVVRLGNVYGYSKNIRINAVINKMMFDAQFKNRITVNGDGSQKRSFINMQNAIEVLAGLKDSEMPSQTFNLLDENLSIMQVVETIKTIYPQLEMIFVNQHMPMRSIEVEPSTELSALLTHKIPFKESLLKFKEMFTF